MIPITIFVPWVGPTGNQVWAGIHWAKRKKIADSAAWAVKIACRGVGRILCPVQLEYTPFHNGRHYDVTNYFLTVKVIEDKLVKVAKILPDDTPRWVRRVILNAPVKSKENQMKVVISEVPDESK